MHEASALLFRAADSCGMGGVDVSAPRSSSAPVSGLVPGAGQSSPGFSLPSRLCPVWCFRMAGGPGLEEGRILGCRTLHGFREGCGFFFRAEHVARERRTDRNRPARKGESRIGKHAPLNSARVSHPNNSKSIKCWRTRQPGVILSEAKNLSVTVIAIRKTTERFFASLRMTASWTGAHRALNGLRFHQWAGQPAGPRDFKK
jgi:hypothetical protein